MKKLILLGALSCSLLTGCWDTEDGSKTGILVKVTKQGIFWGTYHGELIRGGFSDGTGANGQSFNFNLGAFKNSNVDKAMQLMNEHKPVSVTYHCEWFVAPWRGRYNCFVDTFS